MDSRRSPIVELPRRQGVRFRVRSRRVSWLQPVPRRVGEARLKMQPRGPAWWLLYAILPLSAALCALAEYAPASVGWRMLAEGSVAATVIALAWVWVRVNRAALSQVIPDTEMEHTPFHTTVDVTSAPPQVVVLEARRSRTGG